MKSEDTPIEPIQELNDTEVLDIQKASDVEQPSRRVFFTEITNERVSVSIKRVIFLISHLSNADLSILEDFEEFKPLLSVVQKSFVTLGKEKTFGKDKIIVRDTMLLAPGGRKSLASISALYKLNLRKIELEDFYKANMNILLSKDKALFRDYACRDSLITLIHALHMEDFYNSMNEIGIPLSLSNLSAKYVEKR